MQARARGGSRPAIMHRDAAEVRASIIDAATMGMKDARRSQLSDNTRAHCAALQIGHLRVELRRCCGLRHIEHDSGRRSCHIVASRRFVKDGAGGGLGPCIVRRDGDQARTLVALESMHSRSAQALTSELSHASLVDPESATKARTAANAGRSSLAERDRRTKLSADASSLPVDVHDTGGAPKFRRWQISLQRVHATEAPCQAMFGRLGGTMPPAGVD